ncbi:MAG TPA: hypothetical protein VLE53_07770, partial [Gemmatimonadaceae bacterium]|nr:hypothetical protein [Gemmatimonadaceae bacterium]
MESPWSLIRSPWRGLLVAAALILSGTAILHASGYPLLTEALREAGLARVWVGAVQGLWVMFAVHLVLIAGYLLAGALRPAIVEDR